MHFTKCNEKTILRKLQNIVLEKSYNIRRAVAYAKLIASCAISFSIH